MDPIFCSLQPASEVWLGFRRSGLQCFRSSRHRGLQIAESCFMRLDGVGA